ncbi:MAG: toprim domain-containing protein, partial [Candidatus Pacearchaeota archaeon]|nr:toprim domain-containing protein [Candidatus Pacearchaeota archaeon]
MPKPKQKTKAETSSENYFPVDESNLRKTTTKLEKEKTPKKDFLRKTTEKIIKETQPIEEVLKKSVEKKYSQPDKKDIETTEKKTRKTKKKTKKKTSKRTITKEKKYRIPEIKLKDTGYELIITEKPQAASKIANALGKTTELRHQKIPYYEVNRNGKKIYVVCAVGHLFTLKQNTSGSQVPIFDISWVPNFLVKKNDFTKRYYDTILKLAKNAGELTVATDFDVEGEVIGTNVVKYICGQ